MLVTAPLKKVRVSEAAQYLVKMAAGVMSLEMNLIAEVFHYTSVSIVPSLIEHSQREGGI